MFDEHENPYEPPELNYSQIHYANFLAFMLFAIGLGFCLGAIFAIWFIG